MRQSFLPFLVVLTLATAGCSSEVAVSPKGSTIANFKRNPVTQNLTMSGDLKGDPKSAFDAACRALDGLDYYRVGQNNDKTAVYARGPLDVYIEVDFGASKVAGDVLVSVSMSSGSLPDTQAIFSAIMDQLSNPSTPSGFRNR
ncbi:MAG TPA: hypothetical protein VK737_03000 [Opitutales bacterium]|nr:hypothetical protein [Opitutales bacterium]